MTRPCKTARATPDGLLQPGLIEAIARFVPSADDFGNFLGAFPEELWTPALTALMALCESRHEELRVYWPSIELDDTDLPPELLDLLRSVASLRLPLHIIGTVRCLQGLPALVAAAGPLITTLMVEFEAEMLSTGDGQAIADLILQCSSLRTLDVSVMSDVQNDNEVSELPALLQAIPHPAVRKLALHLHQARAVPQAGRLVAQWLRTVPGEELVFSRAPGMDLDDVPSLCDAFQANSTLTKIAVHDVPGLDGFHGRRLPRTLRDFSWNVFKSRLDDPPAPTDAILDDLAHALEHTKLEKLGCNYIGNLRWRLPAWTLVDHVRSIDCFILDEAHMAELCVVLPTLPALASISVRTTVPSTAMLTLLCRTLTRCHVTKLDISCPSFDREALKVVLAAVPDLPTLQSVHAASDLWTNLDLFYCCRELVAAGRHLKELTLDENVTYGPDEDTTNYDAVLRMLSLVANPPFVVRNLPEHIEGDVAEALSQSKDSPGRCTLCLRLAS
ncbi:hypothetical protein SPRG_06562 [Saprolegnia parasitica CBS 223.65]|uniref:FBD domain-containing protein n=1 Tax=Saprolegnia parasitica (strain CBS 223.65) TaxID=695850 RepID=A0A067CPK0_SAPPC|nr:hypothetical protein SPRG_06562 [Saprolegnia parasitica CBS 223.65]KDO28707.1 hypothetical protein SPRG_06562 [Saprolegnia parasitica CBS 223.65]|eukprot:XP_012200763.1 hypothetical protein SPRG_06562 [Saprolegnia parasitica CBS 223.65]